MLDTVSVRRDFPILAREENGKRLVYLDNAATSQKPRKVLDAIQHYYHFHNANVHRGAYTLAVEATEAYEAGRTAVAGFVNAWAREAVVFTRGTTESIIWWPPHGAGPTCSLVTGWWSPPWTITRTSCRGRSCVRKKAPRCGWSRSRRMGASICRTSVGPSSPNPRSWPSPTFRIRSGR